MIPRRVIPNVVVQEALAFLQLAGIPEVELLNEPLSVAPDVIVLCILVEHLGEKLKLALDAAQPGDDQLSMVPDLVVLNVLERYGVEPLDLGV